ncbi:MMPL family transporter [Acidianus manzaensis]|uniref:Antibiotic transporter n=1 Tax=Acidianus manzaensis TaxID=282676 RepID=A0A1W6JY36_9CREN|nr:MMPL family transporter [Acidianus manzaensis]ARM75186.1 antibiotic transporter [Acidianus manzaensis]
MNSKFAKFVSKKWYLIIIVWIIILAVSAPLSSLFFNSVSYQITITTPGSTAAKAENIVSNYFHLRNTGEAGAILILKGNVTPYSLYLSNLTKYGNITITSFFTLEKGILNSTLYSLVNSTNKLNESITNISIDENKLNLNLSKQYTNLTESITKLQELSNGTKEVQSKFINVSNQINDTAKQLEDLHYSMQQNLTAFEKISSGERIVNSSARNESLFLFGYPSEFLEIFTKYYEETHNFTYSSEEAYELVNSSITENSIKEYFNLFYDNWLNQNITNYIQRAENAVIYSANELIKENILNSTFTEPLLHYINITNFENETPYEEFTVYFMNETYHVPLQLSQELYNIPAENVLLQLYSNKTGLPQSFLQEVLNTTSDFTKLSYQLISEKVKNNATEFNFITQVYNNLTESPYIFAVNYISKTYNVNESIVEEVSNFTSYSQFVNYISSQASEKSHLPQWVFSELIYKDNVSNITAYIISTKIGQLDPLLNASHITPKDFALQLENISKYGIYNLSASLIVNYAKFPATLSVNRTQLINAIDLTYNSSIDTLVTNLISKNEFPVQPISNITDQLYTHNLYLIVMTGNFTYNEAKEFQSYISSKINLTNYLTGSKPVSHQLEGIASKAFSVAIPVGIILAILLTGIYFRSFVAALVPLGIYASAFLAASALIYGVVIKLLGITVDFLTPSQVLLLALGLGTDYVVFISSRYIEERKAGKSKDEAVNEAIVWGGKAVTLTALVVMLSFLFLYIYNVPLVSDTSISEMLAVIVVWLSATTLFTSILRKAGDKLFFPAKFNVNKNDKTKPIRKPGLKVVVLTSIVIIFAFIAVTTPLSMNILGLLPASQATSAVNLLDQQFTSNNIFPICLVVNETNGGNFTYQDYQYAVNIYHNLTSLPGVTSVESPVSPYGGLISYNNLSEYNYTEYVSHGYMLFLVNQKYQPFSPQSFNIVQKIENMKIGYVGGGPVDAYNILHFVESDFFEIVLLIGITMYIILVILTRSFSIAGVIIFTIFSAVALTLGLEKLIFTSIGFSIFAIVPLFLVAIIIGIGMDYNIFLISRIHEELEKGNDMEIAVGKTVKSIGKTIIFLGLIFAGTMGSLMLVNAAILQEIGFALSVAAILETSLLWYYLAPSLLVLLFKKFKTRPKMII